MINLKLSPGNFNYLGTEYSDPRGFNDRNGIIQVNSENYRRLYWKISESIHNFNMEIEWGDMFDLPIAYNRFKDGMTMYLLISDWYVVGHVWFKDYKDGRFLFNLFVRNKNIIKTYTGKEFVSDVINRFENNRTIYCEVDDWNIKSIKLFDRLGFITEK